MNRQIMLKNRIRNCEIIVKALKTTTTIVLITLMIFLSVSVVAATYSMIYNCIL